MSATFPFRLFPTRTFIILTALTFSSGIVHAVEGASAAVKTIEFKTGENLNFKSVAKGLRNKKVAFMNFKVYNAELLVAPEVVWSKKAADFVAASPAAVQMTFLRDVPAQNMMDAFTESLKENSADTKAEAYKTFLDTVKKIGDLKENDILIIGRNKTAKVDQVLIQIPGRFKELLSGPMGWSDSILMIWAGKPADAGLKNLQKELFE